MGIERQTGGRQLPWEPIGKLEMGESEMDEMGRRG